MGTNLERGHTGEASKQHLSCSVAGDMDQGKSIESRKALVLGVVNLTTSALKFTLNRPLVWCMGPGPVCQARPVGNSPLFLQELLWTSPHVIGRRKAGLGLR